MIVDLFVERMEAHAERPAIGQFGPSHDVCPAKMLLVSSNGQTGHVLKQPQEHSA